MPQDERRAEAGGGDHRQLLHYPEDPAAEGQARPYRWLVPAASAFGGFLGAVLIVVAVYLIARGADLNTLLQLGYPGVALVMFFSSATVLLPAPGFATLLAASGLGQLNPWLLGLFGALGSSIGELTGYLVGLGSRRVLHPERGRWTRRCEYFMQRWGFLTILVMATIPNPLFDAVGIVAGSLAYPARRLWVACMLGNTVKYTALALLGGTAASFFFGD
jgi:membrane protein YqaA with SNARE-associated domain